ncbi:MAG: YiiX family permuted papain-like enzyme [Bacteroidota bacterium]
MDKKIIIFGFIVIILIGSIYLKFKYDSKKGLENVRKDVGILILENKIQNGDIIFQTSLSNQSKAIQIATKSEYSHCGIIYKEENDYFVFEAIQPVKQTNLENWIARGKDSHFVIKRLKNSEQILTKETLRKMKNIGSKFIGKDYDLTFEWSDDKIYCSELIWKIYKRATGIEIGKLEKLKNFDLSNETVKSIMKKRYGNTIPENEIVISPVAIFESEKLKTIISN